MHCFKMGHKIRGKFRGKFRNKIINWTCTKLNMIFSSRVKWNQRKAKRVLKFYLLGFVFLPSTLFISCASSPFKSRYEPQVFPDRIFLKDQGSGKTYLLTQRSVSKDRVEYQDLRYIVRGQIFRVADQPESRYFLSLFCREQKNKMKYPQYVLDRRPMLETLGQVDSDGVVTENPKPEILIYSFSCSEKPGPIERLLKSAT